MSDFLEYGQVGDDYQVPDLVPFAVTSVGTAAADITFEGGTTVCVCPDNYVMVAQHVNVTNLSASAITVTINIVSGSLTIALLKVILPANTAVGGNQFVSSAGFRLIAPPTFKFQAVSSSNSNLGDIQMLVRLIRGAGL